MKHDTRHQPPPARRQGRTVAALLTASLTLFAGAAWAAPQPEPAQTPLLRPLPASTVTAFRNVRDDRPPAHIVRGIHYVVSNENRHYLFRDAVRGKGGVFVGVGTDQNYLMAGWARPEVLVLLDFDQVVVDLHRVYRLAFLNAETPAAFMKLWAPRGWDRLTTLINQSEPDPLVRA